MRNEKRNSLMMITILGLLAIFANMTVMADESESSTAQYESTDDTSSVSTSPTYVSDEDEEEDSSMTTTTMEDDTSVNNSTDSDI